MQILTGLLVLALLSEGDVGFAGGILGFWLLILFGIYVVGELIFVILRYFKVINGASALHDLFSRYKSLGVDEKIDIGSESVKKMTRMDVVNILVLLFWLIAAVPLMLFAKFLFF